MNPRWRISFELALAMGLLVPVALAQKPVAPPISGPPPPPLSTPSNPATLPLTNSISSPREEDLVVFLLGRVATDDSTPVPSDVMVERICNNRVRQQAYATTHGDFSMQMGSTADSFVDASGDPAPESKSAASKVSGMGIPRRELATCELRASASGFHSNTVSLMGLTISGKSIDVGAIVVQRAVKIKGTTLSARPYEAPKDARKAYEKGREAEKNAKLANAREYFEKAVEIYPQYTSAWFQLGNVLQRENQKGVARTAYTHAAAIDRKFLPPYLALALMAYETEDWREVVNLTSHILDLDPLNHADIKSYIVDFDPSNCAEAYFYNSVANYKLNNFEEAERSALKAEQHVDVRARFPQLHLLLAGILARKNNNLAAISEIQTYLELAPHAKDADLVREELAKLEKLNGSVSTSENPN